VSEMGEIGGKKKKKWEQKKKKWSVKCAPFEVSADSVLLLRVELAPDELLQELEAVHAREEVVIQPVPGSQQHKNKTKKQQQQKKPTTNRTQI